MNAPWPKLAVAQRSDPGRDPNKQENEDACTYQETPLGHLLVVCDGMGGHIGGREASNLAIQSILSELGRAPPGTPPGEALKQAIQAAGRAVWALGGAGEAAGRPGSTCVAALIHPFGTDIAHVGDSRLYLVRGGQIWQLTRDHSMVQEMADAGLLRPEEIAGHPDSNKITRALGMEPEVEVELRHDVLAQQAGDVLLLCSDGVSDVVRDSDLLAMATLALDGARVPQLCDQVVQLANARGGPDNITVVAGLVLEPGLRAQPLMGVRSGPSLTVAEDAGPLIDSGPGTTRMNQPQRTLPGNTAPPPSPPPPAPADASASPSGRRRPGAGATLVLGTNAPQRQATLVDDEGGASATIIDDDDASKTTAPSGGRGKRVVIGALMFIVGAIITYLSLRSMVVTDEAPPPLPDEAPAAPATVAPAK